MLRKSRGALAPIRPVHVEGVAPWFPSLASVMDPAPDLLDRLFTDFALSARELQTQSALWNAFHMYVIHRAASEALNGGEDALRRSAWVIYVTAYWCTVEMRLNAGLPEALLRAGMGPVVLSEKMVGGLTTILRDRETALAKQGEPLFAHLATLMREDAPTGLLYGTAYNSGYLEVISEAPPLGEKPARLKVETGSVRISPRALMRLDYGIEVPSYLGSWRAAFEGSVRAHPERYEQIVTGAKGAQDLRAMWREAQAAGSRNWGGRSLDNYSQAYYEVALYWSLMFNIGLEAISLASFKALIEQDPVIAIRSLKANYLYCAAWSSYLLGFLDRDGQLPKTV
jgi:hypothetical protein